MTGVNDNVVFRELDGITELKLAEILQIAVWGEDDKPDNSDLMLAIQHEGGLVGGAFVDGRLMGFVFGFASASPGVQHSHRLAVHPQARGLGLGARLKWFQRDWCLAHGITLVRWTYDPLRAVNAALNIACLGASVGTYLIDYYGKMEGINAGLPSDRLLAEWQLDSVTVQNRLATPRMQSSPADLRIAIPTDLDALVAADPQAALDLRLKVRAEMTAAFSDGLRVTGFDTATRAYLLTKP